MTTHYKLCSAQQSSYQQLINSQLENVVALIFSNLHKRPVILQPTYCMSVCPIFLGCLCLLYLLELK